MGRAKESFSKNEIRNKKDKKRKEKEKKKLERKESKNSGSFDDMIAYVDENGLITSTPPDPKERTVINTEDIEISIPKRSNDDKVDAERQGVVVFFNDSKGFGFIKDSKAQDSIFVHVNNLEEPVKENDVVTFEVERGPKGQVAVRVRRLK
jgi:cold shock CspA family protein